MLLPLILSFLAPHDCLGCGSEGALLCAKCRVELRPAVARCYRCHRVSEGSRTCVSCRSHSALYAVHATTHYEGLAKDMVWKLKFGRAKAAGTEIGRLLAVTPTNFNSDNVIVTHAPTAASRVRKRGYDQAAVIARAFARKQSITHTPLLARLGNHKQVGASRAIRTSQLQGAFRPLRLRAIQGAHILLIDDVVTTGATLESAARALKDAGAKRVEAIVFAQA